jgi:hypothetical protein
MDPHHWPSRAHAPATPAPYPGRAPNAAHLPVPGSRRAAVAAAAAAEGAAAGAPAAAAAAAAAAGLGPWPVAGGRLREPSRAAPAELWAPEGGSALQVRRKARVRSQEIQAKRGCNPSGWLRNRGGAPSLAILEDAGRSVPRESGRTGPGGSRVLGGSMSEDSGRQEGAGGRSWRCTVIRQSAAGQSRNRGSGCACRPGSELGSCCAAHVLTSAVHSSSAAALGKRGGTTRLPVNAYSRPQRPAAHSQTAQPAGSAWRALSWSSVGRASIRPTLPGSALRGWSQ